MTVYSIARARNSWTFPAVLLLAGCASTSAAAPALDLTAKAPSQHRIVPNDLRPREQLPPEVREALAARMMRHGDEMSALTSAVLMLEYDMAQSLAEQMANEPKLGRPTRGEKGTLNALLPTAFFTQQDALVSSAKALAGAAQRHDDARIVASFGDVAKSCVGCHSAYLNAEVDNAEQEELDRERPCNPEGPCGERELR